MGNKVRFTKAEATRDKLAEQLDNLMRLVSNDTQHIIYACFEKKIA